MDTQNQNTYSIDELSNLSGFDRRAIRSLIEQGLLSGPDKMGRYAQYSEDHLERLIVIKYMRDRSGYSTGAIRTKLLTMTKEQLDVVALKATGDDNVPVKALSSALDYLKDLRGGYKNNLLNNGSVIGESEIGLEVEAKQTEKHGNAIDSETASKNASGNAKANETASKNASANANTSENKRESKAEVGESERQRYEDSVLGDIDNDEIRTMAQRIRAKLLNQDPRSKKRNALERLMDELSMIVGGKRVPGKTRAETWHRISVTPDMEISVRGVDDQADIERLERIADYLREILLGGHFDGK